MFWKIEPFKKPNFKFFFSCLFSYSVSKNEQFESQWFFCWVAFSFFHHSQECKPNRKMHSWITNICFILLKFLITDLVRNILWKLFNSIMKYYQIHIFIPYRSYICQHFKILWEKRMAKVRLLDFLKLHFTLYTPTDVVPSTSKQRVFLLRATWVLLNKPSGQY